MEPSFIAALFGFSTSKTTVQTELERMPAKVVKEKLMQALWLNDAKVANGSCSRHDGSIGNGEIDDPFLLMPNLPASEEWEIDP